MTQVTITLHTPAVGKQRPRFTRTGHTYTAPRTRKFENLVRARAMKVMRELGLKPFEGGVVVTIAIYKKMPASWSRTRKKQTIARGELCLVKPDIDNVEKAIYDALNRVVFVDDSHIVSKAAHKAWAYEDKIEIIVYEKFPSISYNAEV